MLTKFIYTSKSTELKCQLLINRRGKVGIKLEKKNKGIY